MFAKIFLGIFVLLVGSSYLDKVTTGSKLQEYTYVKLKATAKREDALKSAIVRYIIDKDANPTVQNLIDEHYINNVDNGFGGTFDFSINRTKGTIDITTTFENQNQRDIYANLYTRTFKSTVAGDIVSTKYLIPTDLLNSADISDSFRTAVQDAPPDASQFAFWIDTSTNPTVRKVSNGTTWKTYEITTSNSATGGSANKVDATNTVNSTSELTNDGASLGDVKYVYNEEGNTIDEYMYYDDKWIKKNTGDSGYDVNKTTDLLVSKTQQYSSYYPNVISLKENGFLVGFLASGLYQKRYDINANQLESAKRIGTSYDSNNYPGMARLNDDGWIITSYKWTGTNKYDITYFRYNSNGEDINDTVLVNETADYQRDAKISSLKDGGWIVVWKSYRQDGSKYGVYQQRYDSAGVKDGNETLVNTVTNNDQDEAIVVGLSDGGWVVVWTSYRNPGGSYDDIYMQRYDSSGATVGDETRINQYKSSNQRFPSIAALNDGGFIVAWYSDYVYDSMKIGVFFNRYDSNSDIVKEGIKVNEHSIRKDMYNSISKLKDGGWIIVWQTYQNGDYDIAQQRYNSAGEKVGTNTIVNTNKLLEQIRPKVTSLDDGGWVVVWQSKNQHNGRYNEIYLQKFDSDGNPTIYSK